MALIIHQSSPSILEQLTCPCCRSNKILLSRNFTLASCECCKHEWLVKPELIDYASQKDRNPSAVLLQNKSLDREKYLLKFVDVDIKLIEVGCAEGYFLQSVLKRKNVTVAIGIEPSLDRVCSADKSLEVYPSVDPYLAKHIKPKFNVICAFHVLEHIDNPIDFLLSFLELIEDRSWLFIEVPCRSGHPLLAFDPNPEHIHRFTPSSVSALVESAGFMVSSLTTGHYESAAYPNSMRLIAKRIVNNTTFEASVIKALSECNVIWGIGGDFKGYILPSIINQHQYVYVDLNGPTALVPGMAADLVFLRPRDLINSPRYQNSIVLVSTLRYQESIDSFISNNKIGFKKIIFLSDLFALAK